MKKYFLAAMVAIAISFFIGCAILDDLIYQVCKVYENGGAVAVSNHIEKLVANEVITKYESEKLYKVLDKIRERANAKDEQ